MTISGLRPFILGKLGRLSSLLLVVLPLILSACHFSNVPATAPLPDVVKIGLVAPFEGRYRYIGYDAIYAARLAIREINEGGGVGGLRLELVAYDDRGNTEMAARIAHNLVVDPDVIAVVGHYRPETSAAAASVYAAAGLPQIVLNSWVTQSSGAYHLMPDPDRLARAMVAVAQRENPEAVAIWSDATSGTRWREALQVAIGAAPLPITAGEPDLVFAGLSPVDAAERLVAELGAGWSGVLVGSGDLAAPEFGAVGGASAEGVIFVTPYPFPRDLDGLDAWVSAYGSMGPHVPEPGPFALPTYDAIGVVADALALTLEETAVPERRSVQATLREIRHLGLLGTIEFDAGGMWQSAPLYRYRWRAGSPELVAAVP
jgi:branched-chain amino acid transport system substrate-binding protein